MPRVIAFLRAINVGGRNVPMKQLREIFEALGLKNVETFIASGNVIFTSSSRDLAALQRKIENQLRASLGYEVKTFLRTESDVAAVARYQPFTASASALAIALNVGFLDEPLTAGARKALAAFRTETDDFHTKGREVYWLCRKKQSESRFSNVRFEKALKISATFRGAKTIVKLTSKYELR
jgi:uncharacterized protein (DUF1697 family)